MGKLTVAELVVGVLIVSGQEAPIWLSLLRTARPDRAPDDDMGYGIWATGGLASGGILTQASFLPARAAIHVASYPQSKSSIVPWDTLPELLPTRSSSALPLKKREKIPKANIQQCAVARLCLAPRMAVALLQIFGQA